MDLLKRTGLALLLVCPLLLTSCEKYFEGVNDNPNQPETVSMDMLLPSAQMQLAYGNGGDVSRFLSGFMQQVEHIDRAWIVYRLYQLTETEMDNYWRFNMYAGALMDLYKLAEQAEAENNMHYRGISKIMMAYGILTLTDNFGDIPYSEAFLETENLTPAWDSQADIYAAVFDLLEEGQTNLSSGLDGIAPGADDLVHGGDLAAWTKTANVLKARAYLHLSKVDPANYQNALDALGTQGVDSYDSENDNAQVQFGTAPTEAAPWFQFIEQRNDIGYIGTHLDLFMQQQNDPRYNDFIDSTNNTLGPFYGRADAFFFFATYVEQKFIEAEAAFQTGDLNRAATAHNAAVMASLGRYGVSQAAFEAAHAQQTASTISLQEIMEQKYVALFLEPEVFTDWRRTGIPTLTPQPGNVTNDVIPRRLPYPQSERLYNGENFQAAPITSRVWWDLP